MGPYSSAAAAWKPFSSLRFSNIVSCVIVFYIQTSGCVFIDPWLLFLFTFLFYQKPKRVSTVH